jgi:hypothetical protein
VNTGQCSPQIRDEPFEDRAPSIEPVRIVFRTEGPLIAPGAYSRRGRKELKLLTSLVVGGSHK